MGYTVDMHTGDEVGVQELNVSWGREHISWESHI